MLPAALPLPPTLWLPGKTLCLQASRRTGLELRELGELAVVAGRRGKIWLAEENCGAAADTLGLSAAGLSQFLCLQSSAGRRDLLSAKVGLVQVGEGTLRGSTVDAAFGEGRNREGNAGKELLACGRWLSDSAPLGDSLESLSRGDLDLLRLPCGRNGRPMPTGWTSALAGR